MPARKAHHPAPPRMIVEIVFADDRTEHIEVREGDDPGLRGRVDAAATTRRP